MRIDLNCDMGEVPQLAADGTQDRLLSYVSSVNVSCGAHAGDEGLIATTIRKALDHNVSIGAHPGYPDPANFGRVPMDLPAETIASLVESQLRDLDAIACRWKASIRHVKPHGALYNQAATDDNVARAVAEGVRRWRPGSAIVAMAGSPAAAIYAAAGLQVWREDFADRVYEANGSLRSRALPGAIIYDAGAAAAQAVQFARSNRADTICIHSDTTGSDVIAKAVSASLRAAGFEIAAPPIPAAL